MINKIQSLLQTCYDNISDLQKVENIIYNERARLDNNDDYNNAMFKFVQCKFNECTSLGNDITTFSSDYEKTAHIYYILANMIACCNKNTGINTIFKKYKSRLQSINNIKIKPKSTVQQVQTMQSSFVQHTQPQRSKFGSIDDFMKVIRDWQNKVNLFIEKGNIRRVKHNYQFVNGAKIKLVPLLKSYEVVSYIYRHVRNFNDPSLLNYDYYKVQEVKKYLNGVNIVFKDIYKQVGNNAVCFDETGFVVDKRYFNEEYKTVKQLYLNNFKQQQFKQITKSKTFDPQEFLRHGTRTSKDINETYPNYGIEYRALECILRVDMYQTVRRTLNLMQQARFFIYKNKNIENLMSPYENIDEVTFRRLFLLCKQNYEYRNKPKIPQIRITKNENEINDLITAYKTIRGVFKPQKKDCEQNKYYGISCSTKFKVSQRWNTRMKNALVNFNSSKPIDDKNDKINDLISELLQF